MKIVTVCKARALAAAGTWTSGAIHVTSGWFWSWSVEVVTTGTGTLTVQFQTSLDGTNYYTGATAICTAVATGSTPIIYTPTIPLTPWIKFILTEAGSSNAVTATVIACYA